MSQVCTEEMALFRAVLLLALSAGVSSGSVIPSVQQMSPGKVSLTFYNETTILKTMTHPNGSQSVKILRRVLVPVTTSTEISLAAEMERRFPAIAPPNWSNSQSVIAWAIAAVAATLAILTPILAFICKTRQRAAVHNDVTVNYPK